ncbi:response regulator transcription factor [Roseovarius sp. ZX-A-9]|uniref:response regulator transcription factor n=1 Tax=Roseovarius sp. ZX-A-9 TaxID=3014783 RepID=UPI00232D5464|nr:response regulator [Roseovarius sp. ZX-A-9]
MIDILIAEDEPAILDPLSFILELAGWQVASVTDGEAALIEVQRQKPRLLLLDIMLPKLSGLDVLRILRGEPRLADIPVLIVTARGQSRDRGLALDLKADGFITKPFDNDELIEEVRRLLALNSVS